MYGQITTFKRLLDSSCLCSYATTKQTISFYFFFFIYFYLFMRDTGREARRSRLHAGSPMWDLISGLQDHTLGCRQTLNHWATWAPQFHFISNLGRLHFKIYFYFMLMFHGFTAKSMKQNYLKSKSCPHPFHHFHPFLFG